MNNFQTLLNLFRFHSMVRTFRCGFLCYANQTSIYSMRHVSTLASELSLKATTLHLAARKCNTHLKQPLSINIAWISMETSGKK